MEVRKTNRGFEVIEHPHHMSDALIRIVQQSSAVGDYSDSLLRPGSSFLWVGEHHHLDRDEVRQLAKHLEAWASTGSLAID